VKEEGRETKEENTWRIEEFCILLILNCICSGVG